MKILPEVSKQLDSLINNSVEDADPETRSIVARILLAQRGSKMIHIDGETYADTSLLNCAEYQLFLDEQRVHGRHYQPDHWKDYHFPPGKGKIPILGVRQSDASAFCVWLTQQDPGIWRYRLPKSGECENNVVEGNKPARIPAGIGYWLGEDGEFRRGTYPVPLFESMIKDQFFLVQYHMDSLSAVMSLFQDQYSNLEHLIKRTHHFIRESNYDSAKSALLESRSIALSVAYDLGQVNFNASSNALELSIDFELIRAYIRNRAYPLDLDHLNRTALAIGNHNNTMKPFEYSLVKSLSETFSIKLTRSLDRGIVEKPIHRISIIDDTANTAFDLIRFLNNVRCQKTHTSIHSTIDSYLDAYVLLTALEERIKDNLPPCEGILLIKERSSDSF